MPKDILKTGRIVRTIASVSKNLKKLVRELGMERRYLTNIRAGVLLY
jgi:hypothetical protein